MKNELAAITTTASAGGKTSVLLFPGIDGQPPVSGLVRADERGLLQAVKTLVPLSIANKELWKFRGEEVLTALGYRKVNQFLGVSFINPETVPGDDGRVKPNPHYRRSKDGRLLGIRQRKIGFWTNAVGKPVLYDYTIDFDLTLYLAQDLYAKWAVKGYRDRDGKQHGGTTKEWGRLVPELSSANLTSTEKGYILPDGSYLIVDLGHPDVVGVIGEHINRQRFAGRLADTFCERNILKKAIPTTKVGKDGTVAVVSWQTFQDEAFEKLGKTYTDETLQSALHGREGGFGQDVIYDPVEIESVIDGETAEDEAAPQEAQAVPGSIAPSAQPPPVNQELQDARARIRELAEAVGIEPGLEALGRVGLDGLEEVAICGNVTLLRDAAAELERVQLTALHEKRVKEKGGKKAAKKIDTRLPLEGDHAR